MVGALQTLATSLTLGMVGPLQKLAELSVGRRGGGGNWNSAIVRIMFRRSLWEDKEITSPEKTHLFLSYVGPLIFPKEMISNGISTSLEEVIDIMRDLN
ncbi:hypothetical protein VNO78_28583 [Psophocarpus tetragonolobus]|uniref:Uncharacterized protein n=1 Tax=Psophocarpus tetragonolobus TaxID=3891 RepID=A0AAN9WYE9_PSOTE